MNVVESAEFRVHPLGFFYVEAVRADTRCTRIHIWLQEPLRVPENDRHQHSFDVRSTVLAGNLQTELYSFVPSDSGTTQEFAVEYDQAGSRLNSTGRLGNLVLTAVFETAEGQSYYLASGTIHRAQVVRRPCVTVFKTVDRGVPIFSYGSDLAEPPFVRRSVNRAEADEIQAILQTLPKGRLESALRAPG